MAISRDVVEALRAKFEAVLPHLDERQQRLVMAGEARSLGHGGIAAVAGATGVSRSRISQGVAELEAGDAPAGPGKADRWWPQAGDRDRSRASPGTVGVGGTDPARRSGIGVVLDDVVDPNLADELTAAGHKVGPDTVGRLLHEQGFSLQANSKTLEGVSHPDRDAQFSYINDQAADHLAAGDPVISVDAKKKELVGEYKNGGREWRPAGEPEKVKVHDFIDRNLGKANPYGVYDLAADTGWVSVGDDHDTAAFAVETIRPWWNTMGANTYPSASRLLITADGGGSNGSRTRLWKTELATLASQTGLTITVCHLPPGTSKWNRIEHRLFSHISMNWRGRPLTSHEVIVQTIAATTTRTGLSVHAELDTSDYPTGLTIPDSTMKALSESGTLTRHEWHPDWNYSLKPPSN